MDVEHEECIVMQSHRVFGLNKQCMVLIFALLCKLLLIITFII